MTCPADGAGHVVHVDGLLDRRRATIVSCETVATRVNGVPEAGRLTSMRGVEQAGSFAGLITRRSRVQIPPRHCREYRSLTFA